MRGRNVVGGPARGPSRDSGASSPRKRAGARPGTFVSAVLLALAATAALSQTPTPTKTPTPTPTPSPSPTPSPHPHHHQAPGPPEVLGAHGSQGTAFTGLPEGVKDLGLIAFGLIVLGLMGLFGSRVVMRRR